MKKAILLTLLLGLFVIACKNKNDKKEIDISKTKDNFLNNADTEKVNVESKNASSWSSEDAARFNRECQQEFSKENLDNATINKLCPCLLSKMSAKYTDYNDLDKNGADEVIERNAKQCIEDLGIATNNNNGSTNNNGNGWTQAQRSEFVRDCKSEAIKNVGAQRAQVYCECMQQKIENLFSTYAEANTELTKLTQAQIQELASDCNK